MVWQMEAPTNDGERETVDMEPSDQRSSSNRQPPPSFSSGHFLPPRSQGGDPYPSSSREPLSAYDHSIFRATFPTSPVMELDDPNSNNPALLLSNSLTGRISIASPPSALSSSKAADVIYTPRAEHQEDPFFYPFLCENERKRLRAFWSLTSGMHDDKGLATYLQGLLTIIKELYDFDTAAIQFIDNDRSSSLDVSGWGDMACPRRETACAHTMLLQPGVSFSLRLHGNTIKLP